MKQYLELAVDELLKAIKLIAEEPATSDDFKRAVLMSALLKFSSHLDGKMK